MLIKMVDCVVVNSKGMRKTLERYCGKSDKIKVVHVGIDIKNLKLNHPIPYKTKQSKEEKIVGFVGNANEQKGIIYLIRAIPKILNKFPLTRFLIIGGGEIGTLQKEARNYGVEDNISFIGPQLHQHIPTLISSFNIAILPSLWEPLSLFCCEAAYLGKPIVASDVDGNPEVVKHNINGLLFPPKDVNSLAEAIIELLEDERRAKKMGEEGRKIVEEHFTLSLWVKRFTDCVKEMLEKCMY
jgi:glycosyltransferase involved in cell wall biosynthesis